MSFQPHRNGPGYRPVGIETRQRRGTPPHRHHRAEGSSLSRARRTRRGGTRRGDARPTRVSRSSAHPHRGGQPMGTRWSPTTRGPSAVPARQRLSSLNPSHHSTGGNPLTTATDTQEAVGTSNLRFDFTGRTVIVTGAGKGIGRSLAEAFAGANADVVLVGRSAEAL